jgi:protein-L-isoaspartate(D-aspartate) O-methyltransferase
MEKLIADIEQATAHSAFMTGIKHIDNKVLSAIRHIDRKHFVRSQDQDFAYLDSPLDIGCGQTISQPFIVALMVHLIEPKAHDKILEVGSGSGYVVAILSKLCKEVIGLEIVPELAERSRQALQSLHITNATIVYGDGNLGLPEYAPFDKIIISAAVNKLPDMLLDELSVGGVLIFPKNISPFEQMLTLMKKTSSHEYKIRDILPVRFVPMVNS